jgi:hypothetical protein
MDNVQNCDSYSSKTGWISNWEVALSSFVTPIYHTTPGIVSILLSTYHMIQTAHQMIKKLKFLL